MTEIGGIEPVLMLFVIANNAVVALNLSIRRCHIYVFLLYMIYLVLTNLHTSQLKKELMSSIFLFQKNQ